MTASSRLLSVGALLALLMYASVTGDEALPPHGEPPQGRSRAGCWSRRRSSRIRTFSETVVYVVQHNRAGAMGLVINRLLGTGPLDRMLEGMGIAPNGELKIDLRVHYGGPVEPSRAFVLHSPEYHAPDTMVVSDIAALTVAPGILQDMAAGNGPERSLFVLGYAGWGPDQLENELAAGAWVVVEPDATLLFDEETTTKWQRAYDRRGVEL